MWHITGTVVAGDRSKRVRRSTKFAATADSKPKAEAIRQRVEDETLNELVYGVKPTVAISIACRRYLDRPRKKPMAEYDVWVIKEIAKRFRTRPIREIEDDEWIKWADKKQEKNSLSTRERFLNSVCAFLGWTDHPSRMWRDRALPPFERYPEARTKKAPARRRVADLTPEMITLLIESMPRHIIPQIAVEWSTGHRVSSILMECRICDAILAEGREQITFLDTKNGEPWTATLHPWAAEKLREYLAWRGNLKDREGPLFLTDKGLPYGAGAKGSRGRNKTGFRNGRAKAVKWLIEHEREDDAQLLAQVTQHWLRHWLATHTMDATGNLRGVMDQQGWKDPRSPMRYIHDVSGTRRAAINSLPIGNPQTRGDFGQGKKDSGSNG